MSSHAITVAGFVAFAITATVLNLLAHRPGSRIPTIGALFTRIMHSRTGRIAVVAWGHGSACTCSPSKTRFAVLSW